MRYTSAIMIMEEKPYRIKEKAFRVAAGRKQDAFA